jgi:hypothetical protein
MADYCGGSRRIPSIYRRITGEISIIIPDW